jgi:hypothetical protein
VSRKSTHGTGRAVLIAVLILPGCLNGQATPSPIPSDTITAPDASGPSAWNAAPALSLIRRAIVARRHAYADSSLQSFRADVQGHVYFIGDLQGEREVIRADQVALNVHWQAPNRALQTIVGRRHEVRLPTTIRYHVDHLSLVLDNFGDRIRLGDGDEVQNVLHPAAPAAVSFYEFRLADSLTIRIRDRVVRLFELKVRPVNADDPGIVGSLFIDQETGAIARMGFTFTRTAYRDPELVQIVLDLRSALWDGYWLPVEQDVEITRSLSWFDFPVETVIRTRLEVLEYHLNDKPELAMASGQRIASYPKDALESFNDWSHSLYGGPIREGEYSDSHLAQATDNAQSLIRQGRLTGGDRLQLSLPNTSAGVRIRRAEGLLLGAGGAYQINDQTQISFWGGYPTSLEKFEASMVFRREVGRWTTGVEAKIRSLEDVGSIAASGVIQTLALAVAGEDYQDPFFQDGVRISLEGKLAQARVELGGSILRERTADLLLHTTPLGSNPLRAVRPIEEGMLAMLDGTLDLPLGKGIGASWKATLLAEAATGSIGSFGFSRVVITIEANKDEMGTAWAWSSKAKFGISGGTLPAQRLFAIGGRGTVPGYAFRAWGGDRFALWHTEISRILFSPWVRLRAQAAAGRTQITGMGMAAADRFGITETSGVRGSAGLGLGIFYDLVRLDLVRGLSRREGGEWVFFLSLNPALWKVL